MVSLRDGKTYDVDATPSRRRATRRSIRRESTAVVNSQLPYVEVDDEPQTPLETASRGSKRNRPAQQRQPQVDNAEKDDDTCDQNVVPVAGPPLSPITSPRVPSKKQRIETQVNKDDKFNATRCAAIAVALVAIVAVGVWPYLAGSGPLSANGLVTAVKNSAAGEQMHAKITDLEGAAVAYASFLVQLLHRHALYAHEHMSIILRQLQLKAPSLVPPSLSGMMASTADASAWSPEVLYKVLPSGDHWRELAKDITERLRTPAAQRSYKAAAFILACATADDCEYAANMLKELPPRGAACSLQIVASSLIDGTNQPSAVLQSILAPFLKRCPSGLVLISQAEQLPVAALPALHNALSEQGGFQYNGAVDSSRAAYVLLMQMPLQHAFTAATAPTGASEIIKKAFIDVQQVTLQQQRPQQRDSPAGDSWAVMDRALKTLHRRIDFAAPVRFGRAAQAELTRLLQAQKSTSFDERELQAGLAGSQVAEA